MTTINTTGSSIILSDKSITGEYEGNVSTTSRQKGWRDLDLSLILHPIRGDITPLKDDVAIKNAIKNLLLTNFFERPFNSDVGANLRALLFEPADAITEIALRDNISRVIRKYEPRVELRNTSVTFIEDSNAYNIIVSIRVKETDTEQNVEIILRRLR